MTRARSTHIHPTIHQHHTTHDHTACCMNAVQPLTRSSAHKGWVRGWTWQGAWYGKGAPEGRLTLATVEMGRPALHCCMPCDGPVEMGRSAFHWHIVLPDVSHPLCQHLMHCGLRHCRTFEPYHSYIHRQSTLKRTARHTESRSRSLSGAHDALRCMML